VTLHVIDACEQMNRLHRQLTVTDNTPPTISTCAPTRAPLPMEFVSTRGPTLTTNGLVVSGL